MKRTLRSPGFPSTGIARLRDDLDATDLLAEPLAFGVWSPEPRAQRSRGWIPPMDVCETDTHVVIRLEAPGIAVADLDISIAGNLLSVAGRKPESTDHTASEFYLCERRFGSFRRIIDLPPTADPASASAESDNGLITIRIAKSPAPQTRQLEIKPAQRALPLRF